MTNDFLSAPPEQDVQTASARSRRPFIRLAGFEDYEQITAVEARNNLTTRSREQWLDLWLANPAYRELRDWPIGWVIEDGAGTIVGCLGNVPSFCYFGGKRYVAAAGRGWAVDSQYRSLSVMLLAHQLKQPYADLNVVATAGSTTAHLCTKLGWSRVPVGEWNRSAFWIANYTKAVQAFLEAKTPSAIAIVAGALVSPPLRLKDALSTRPYTFENSGYQFGWCRSFDARFDTFWNRLKEESPDQLLTARDESALSWHFKHALRQNLIWILTVSKGSQLAGYAVLERRRAQSLDLSRALFLDMQSGPGETDLCSKMVRFALNRCRAEGVHILENAGCWIETRETLRPVPYHRDLETWSYLYRVANPELQGPLRHASAWCPTQYDGDASL